MLVQLLTGSPAEFDRVDDVVPYVGEQRGAPELLPGAGRLLKSHEALSRFNSRAYRKVVYLVRDGRDVAASYYRAFRDLGWFEGDFSRFLRRFLAGRLDGYGPWHEHVRGWLRHSHDRAILEVRYEALRDDPHQALGGVASFLGIAVEPGALAAAIAANSAEEMRRRDPRVHGGRQARLVGAARPESWRGLFSADDLSRFLRATDGLLDELGYADAS